MKTCGNCKHWDTDGFGFRTAWGSNKASSVGRCKLVARHCFPMSPDKMISLLNNEYSSAPGLTEVVTRREFGCNQFKRNKKTNRKNARKLNLKKIAENLGAKHITDPKEKEEFEKKYGFPHPLLPKPKK